MAKIQDILLLTRGFPPPFVGGSGRYLYNILMHFPPNTVTIFTEKSRASHEYNKLAQRFIRRRYIFPFDPPNRFARWVRKFSMVVLWPIEVIIQSILKRSRCIVVAQIPVVGFVGPLLKYALGIPYIVIAYGEDLSTAINKPLRRFVRGTICRKAKYVVTISDFTERMLIDYGVDPQKIVLAHPGIDVDRFRSQPDEVSKLRASLAPENHQILLTIGRLTPRKGHAFVLAVLPQILKEIPDLTYVIVGKDGGEKKHLEALVQELNLQDHVSFLGQVSEDDIPKLYAACDVFVMANYERSNNDTEGFGIVFLEANAARKPVIGGNAGGARDAIANGVSGLSIDATDTQQLFETIKRLLSDEAYANQLGQQGYERVVREFSWEKTSMIVQEILMAATR